MNLSTNIPLIFREKVEKEIVPELIEAGKSVLAAHEIDPDHFTNYFVGCACFDNVFSRLTRLCRESDFFVGEPYKNTLEVKADVEGIPISFYVSRVDEKTRIPNAGKSIKRIAQEWQYLSDEVRAIVEEQGVYILGYNITTTDGFGEVTFDLLTNRSKTHIQVSRIFTFDVNIPAGTFELIQPETTKKPAVFRKEVEPKASTKKQTK